jgi:nitrile hydratase alpha subunit
MAANVPEGDFNRQWAELVAKAWADDGLRERLVSDPKAVMEEHGLPVPPDIDVRIVQNTENVIYLPLAKNPLGDLSEEDLNQVVANARPIGGYCGNDTCSVTYFPLRGETSES